MHTHRHTHVHMLTHTCTCAHRQSTQSPHAHIHTRGGTQPTCSHTHGGTQSPHAHTHTHGGMHGAHALIHTQACTEPTCSHGGTQRALVLTCTRRPHMAGCLPPAGGSHPATLFARAPAARTQKRGHLGRVPMLGDNCGILSPELTAARLSEELTVFLETLTCGHFTAVLLQLNGQHEGRPLSCVHHLWTQNCDPRGLCCREQSTQMCVWGLGWGLRVCIGTPHALSRCSAPSLGHPDEGGVDGMAIRAGVFMDAMNPILRVSSEPT